MTGDTVQDKIRLDEFAAMARERRDIAVDPKNANRAIISVGADLWPLPIPLVKHGGRWSFDAAAGRAECSIGASAATSWTPSRCATVSSRRSSSTR